MYVQFQIDSEYELGDDREIEEGGECAMKCVGELTASMVVRKDVPAERQYETCNLFAIQVVRCISTPTFASSILGRTWVGVCHLLRASPKTIPTGKRIPQTNA